MATEYNQSATELKKLVRALMDDVDRLSADVANLRTQHAMHAIQTQSDLAASRWLADAGLSDADVRVTRYIPARVFLSGETGPKAQYDGRREVYTALLALLDMAGFKWAVDIEESEGSWWREFWARSWKLLTRQEVTDRIQLAEDALKAKYLDIPQAEANLRQAKAASELIKALKHTHNAAIQVGTLLVIKETKGQKSAIAARTLTADELRLIEEDKTILKQPSRALEMIGGVTARTEVPPPD